MRSSVAESRPRENFEARSWNTLPQPEFRTQYPQRQTAQPATHKPPRHPLSLTPSEGWLAMLLLMVAVYSIVFSIIFANWVSNSFILLWSAAAGLLAGLCIAKIQGFPQAILHLAACLVGHWLSIWLTSAFAFHISWLLLLENLRAVLGGGFNTSASSSSEMVFLFYLTFLSFFLGYFGAWLIYRAHLPWLVALVYCAIMLVNLNYIKQDLSYLVIIMLGALILLIARIQLFNQLTRWTDEGLHTDRAWLQNISRRFVQIGSLFTLLILLISWILPILAQPVSGVYFWNNLDNTSANITHGQFTLSSPGSLFQPYQPPANFFGDQLHILGNVNLPTSEVLNYTSSARSQSQYLEGFTFDHFDGHTWISSTSESQAFPANIQLPWDTPSRTYSQVTTTVNIVLPPGGTKHYLFAPAQPRSFSVPTTLYGNGVTTAWTQQIPLTQQERYQVTSWIPATTAQNLSAIPFPKYDQNLWLRDSNMTTLEQYLQKPTDLPPNVLQTVRQWTRGSTNVYDAMKKLESRLSDQTQFIYSLSNPPVPPNIDAVAWLLQRHQGYCTYYASAMTIMARMLGVPARIVNGFSQGHFDQERNVWDVYGSDAHSWVQVYFPGFGWINFDPTPGFSLKAQPTQQTGRTAVQTPPPTGPTPITTAGTYKPGNQPTSISSSTGAGTDTASPGAVVGKNLLLAFSLLTLLVSLIVFGMALVVSYRRTKLNINTNLSSAIFWRICRYARLAGLPPQGWQTPYEYHRMLSQRFPQATASLRWVTELFVRERWAAPHEIPRPVEEQALEKLWPHLRKTFVRSLFTGWSNRKIS